VAEELRSGEPDGPVFVGTPDGPEAALAAAAGLEYLAVDAKGFDRGAPLSIVPAVLTLVRSTLKARRMIGRLRPHVVVCFGGYVCLPVGLAAVVKRVPLVLHEQNSVPGLANRVLSRWASAVAVTYPESKRRLLHPERAVATGNPVREGIVGADRASSRRALGAGEDTVVLLVFGGSRGARHINEAMIGLAPALAAAGSLRVLHAAGRIEAADVRRAVSARLGGESDSYSVVDYISDMGEALAAADLVVARAGATSIAEITAAGKASILVPYPFATEDHQTTNAAAVEAAGGAVLVADDELESDRFESTLWGLLEDGAGREKMAKAAGDLARVDAAAAVAAVAREAAGASVNRDAADESG
jgi:UDP-N-acetylglucosamine--N-acetylmuramyl-(pentapeptide) pyrophosphoryl-undecaprenol N-acetylglucosamine transferase